MNFYFKQFYNDVKDPSWPEVNTYADYVKLPEWIRKECKQHGIQTRFEQIEDINYCADAVMYGYQYKNLVYVPVKKCASTYYGSLFENELGWKLVGNLSKLDNDTVFFGTIMDPTTRWLKGLAQFLYQSDVNDDRILKKMMTENVVFAPDLHTVPYTMLFGDMINKINWFPIDYYTETEVKQQMMKLFKKHGHDIQIPLDNEKLYEPAGSRSWMIRNEATPDKLNLLNKLTAYHQQNVKDNKESHYLLQILFANDLKFYRQLINSILNG